MSVLIKGMKKPDNCEICPYAFCHLDTRNCPIVAIPDHGDLIDRRALKKSLINEGETIGIDGFSIEGLSTDDVCYAIENAPVVIQAERSDDGET